MYKYKKLLRDITEKGEMVENRTGIKTVSLFGYQLQHDLRNGFPLLTTKNVPFRWVAEELFWFLRGDTSENSLREVGVDIWKEWSNYGQTKKFHREEGDLGPIYGYQWRSFGGNYPKPDGFDQFEWLLNEMKENPDSRRLIISAWHPQQALEVTLPPCHTLFQFKIYGDRLDCQLYQRSADAFLGVPFNIASYSLLTHMIAHVMDLTPGIFTHTFGDVHLYENHLSAVCDQLGREPYDLPTLEIINADDKKGLDGLLDINFSNLRLTNYRSHGKIVVDVAV